MFQNPEQAFGGTTSLLETIETIYASVQEPGLWNTALARIASALDGESLGLFAVMPDDRSPNILALANVSLDVWNKFAGYYAGINPLMARAVNINPRSETIFSQALMRDVELEHTEFYVDFYRPNRMHHTVGMLLNVENVDAAFTCQRPFSAGEFGERAGIICQTLRPHLMRALLLHHRMGTLQAATLGLDAALSAHEHAVVGLDSSLRVVMCNRTAEKLFIRGDSVRLKNDRLTCRRAEDAKALAELLRKAADLRHHGVGGSIAVRGVNGSRLDVSVFPFRVNLPGASASISALVFLADPSTTPCTRAEAVRALYGLTPAETRVADLLLAGLEVREIAERLGVTLDTARYHLKQIFAKTGVRRQTELVRRMLALPVTQL